MASRGRNRKAERGEIELLRGLVTLANQLQSSLELDAIVHVIATALSETFGFREATVYLAEPDGDTFRVHATVGEQPEHDRELFHRPVPRRIWDELFQVRYQMGSSYFVDHRQHTWTEEQLHYLPSLDLGSRRADEWHQDDDLLVPLYDKQHELMGVLDLYNPVDRRHDLPPPDLGPRREGEWSENDALLVPLYDKRHELMGVLDLCDPIARSLPTLDVVKSLEVFATHAAVAIENARQYQQLESARGQLEAQLALRHVLLDLSAALLSTLGERELFAQSAALLREIVDYDAMEIRLVDEEARELYCGYASDEDVELMSSWRAPLDVGVSGWVLLHNEAQLVNDMLNDPRGALVPGTDWVPQASIIAPLNVGGKVIGVLALDRMGEKIFHDNELESAELFANLAAIAIQNARQYEQLQRTSEQLEGQLAIRHRLLNLSTTLLGTLDQTTVFHEVTGMLKEIVDYDAMNIRLVEEESRELVCIYSRDENAEQMLSFRMSLDEGISGWVARHNQAQLVNDMAHDPRVAQVPGTEEEEPQASIIVPLTVRGTVTGVLCLDRMDGRLFEEHELEPAMLFANMAAIAIQNARTYEEMERQAISDGLTGIHNYRHFQETLKAEVHRAERYGETFCLLMMDLDHFKSVNDTIGHQKGDEVLRAVSDVLRTCSRESDYLARYGGEEFAIILPRTVLDEARTLAERIRASVAAIDIGRCPHCQAGRWQLLHERSADRQAIAALLPPTCRGPP